MKNYYEILGVNFDATQDEIKKAYRDLMKQYHPDKHPEDGTGYYEQKSKNLNEAYEVLSNEEKRRQYNIEYILYKEEQTRKQERRKQKEEQARKQKEEQARRQQQNTRRTTGRQNEEYREYRTNRTKSRAHSRHKVSDDTFFGSIRKSYKEIKDDESKYPFKERHKNLNQKYHKKYNKRVNSTNDLIIFHICQGIVHISVEALYQLSKLSYINKDNVIKYIFRNRRLAAAVLAGFIIVSNIPGKTTNPSPIDRDEVAGVVVEEPTESYEDTITLFRNYEVVAGDSLSTLSDMTLTKIGDIKRVNGFTTDMLYLGDIIKLPYIVKKDDLQYYTEIVETNGMSLTDLAYIYETDEDTLYRLNKDAIGEIDGIHIITATKIFVPKFITSYEYQQRKEGKVKVY